MLITILIVVSLLLNIISLISICSHKKKLAHLQHHLSQVQDYSDYFQKVQGDYNKVLNERYNTSISNNKFLYNKIKELLNQE